MALDPEADQNLPHICRFDPGQRHSVRRCLTIAYPEGLLRGAWGEKEYSGSFWRRPMLRWCSRIRSSMEEQRDVT